MRPSHRKPDELRTIQFTRHYIKHPEGSVLVEFGDTKVLCNASLNTGVPRFLKDAKQGWLTAEYSMLPRATHTRTERESNRGIKGRTQEIQRLIGRTLRSAVDLNAFPGHTIVIDCDVLQADGGTRTAAITGACVALCDALTCLKQQEMLTKDPLNYLVASVSVGIYQGKPILDLDYNEDSQADTDMNIVMNEAGDFIELQGTAEKNPFPADQLQAMLTLGKKGILQLIQQQKAALEIT